MGTTVPNKEAEKNAPKQGGIQDKGIFVKTIKSLQTTLFPSIL